MVMNLPKTWLLQKIGKGCSSVCFLFWFNICSVSFRDGLSTIREIIQYPLIDAVFGGFFFEATRGFWAK